MGRHRAKPEQAGAVVLGGRIRQLRVARGLTLKELGHRSGLSHAFLSQVERGLARPSVSTLTDIAGALGIGVATLVSQTSTGFARLVRGATAPRVVVGPSADTVAVRALTGADALMKVTESVGHFPRSESMAHAGEEVVYVLEGAVEVTVNGNAFVLGPGDVLNFDCSVEHTYRSLDGVPPRFLVIAADPGQYASPIDESVYAYRQASGRERD